MAAPRRGGYITFTHSTVLIVSSTAYLVRNEDITTRHQGWSLPPTAATTILHWKRARRFGMHLLQVNAKRSCLSLWMLQENTRDCTLKIRSWLNSRGEECLRLCYNRAGESRLLIIFAFCFSELDFCWSPESTNFNTVGNADSALADTPYKNCHSHVP